LPERAVQFGTGALLRGLIDYFLDAANRQGRFLGRVVMVSSTGSGRDTLLADQDHLFTLAVQGLERGVPVEHYRVIGSVSRALSAVDQWQEVLACARNPELQLVFSNTTEIGITLDEGDGPDDVPPRSFPGKLARFLLERALAFDYDPARGVVVLPCELIEENGSTLRSIVLAHAERWGVDPRFAEWIRTSVPFCDTLVDRIVPGAPDAEGRSRLEATLGYRDEMLTTAEVYRLFAIRTDDTLRARLRFAGADDGIVLTPDVRPYHERKVRILNGGHTLIAPVALMAGLDSVADAVEDPLVGRYLRHVLFRELVPSLEVDGGERFAHETLERWANPFLRHALFDITLQATMKMRVRVVPSILRFARAYGRAPEGVALGFAAHILFLRGDLQRQRAAEAFSVPPDGHAAAIADRWRETGADADSVARLGDSVCADTRLWGEDLSRVTGFAALVSGWLVRLHQHGVRAALPALVSRVEP
jgi:tagaturonate reductase